MSQKKVLALAFECNPEWPSLPAVAYKYALALGEDVELTLVTQKMNRENIDKAGSGSVRFDYVNIDPVLVPLERLANWIRGGNELGWTTLQALRYPTYLVFELVTWLRYRKALKRGHFDVVHRMTPMTPTLPSVFPSLSKVPFVLGPLNGGLDWPKAFTEVEKQEKEWLRPLRNLYKRLPFSRSSFRRSEVIMASFDHTIADLPADSRDKIIDFPEVGLDPALFSGGSDRPVTDAPVTVAFIGRLVPYKLPEFAARAFASSPLLQQHRLVYVGDGPMRGEIETLIEDNGLQDCVSITGWVQQHEVGDWMRSAEIMAFPSIRELGAGVVVEAMACGMVPVVCDYGAPGTLVGTERGVAVPVESREQVVEDLRRALEDLVQDRERIRRLSRNAQDFALTKFPWSAKSAETVRVYDWALSGRSDVKPDFWNDPTPTV